MAVATTFGNTMGAMLLGIIGSSMLYGVLLVQTFLYFSRYRNDRVFQKFSVGILFLLATLSAVFSIYTIHHYLVGKFGNLTAQGYVIRSFKFLQGLDILTVILVQSLYALRVWKLGRSIHKIWPVVVVIVVAGGTAAGLTLFVEVARLDKWAEMEKLKTTVNVALAAVVLTDIMVAVTICYYLQQSRSGFSSTNNKLLRVMQYVLTCGFLTTGFSLAALILFGVMPETLVFVAVNFLTPKLYINSYLALLNARKAIQGQDNSFTVSKVYHLQTRRGQTETSQFGTDDENGKNTGIRSLVEQPKIDITVHHTVDQQRDSSSMLPHMTR